MKKRKKFSAISAKKGLHEEESMVQEKGIHKTFLHAWKLEPNLTLWPSIIAIVVLSWCHYSRDKCSAVAYGQDWRKNIGIKRRHCIWRDQDRRKCSENLLCLYYYGYNTFVDCLCHLSLHDGFSKLSWTNFEIDVMQWYVFLWQCHKTISNS